MPAKEMDNYLGEWKRVDMKYRDPNADILMISMRKL
jgi:hypothetical protein